MVDVDLYSSAVSTLKVLDTEYENVLPRVHMYFDDIFRGYECIGENIALKEFNEQHKGKICISPEGTESSFFWTDNGWHVPNNIFVMDRNIKLCHYFRHPKYNQFIKSPVRDLPLSMLDI